MLSEKLRKIVGDKEDKVAPGPWLHRKSDHFPWNQVTDILGRPVCNVGDENNAKFIAELRKKFDDLHDFISEVEDLERNYESLKNSES